MLQCTASVASEGNERFPKPSLHGRDVIQTVTQLGHSWKLGKRHSYLATQVVLEEALVFTQRLILAKVGIEMFIGLLVNCL